MRGPIMSKWRSQLSRGHFPNKPHLTEHAFLFPLACPLSLCYNPPTPFCWVGVWRSCEGQAKDSEVRSELGALTSDWPQLWVTETETSREPKALWRSKQQVGCSVLTKGELCRGGEAQWDGLWGGGEESSISTISTSLWKPALFKNSKSIGWRN